MERIEPLARRARHGHAAFDHGQRRLRSRDTQVDTTVQRDFDVRVGDANAAGVHEHLPGEDLHQDAAALAEDAKLRIGVLVKLHVVAVVKQNLHARAGPGGYRVAVEYAGPVPGALATTEFSKGTFGELSLGENIAVLKDKVSAVQRGDLRDAEALLTTQAVALNVIFTELARRAALNMSTYLAVTDTYLRLALKAKVNAGPP